MSANERSALGIAEWAEREENGSPGSQAPSHPPVPADRRAPWTEAVGWTAGWGWTLVLAGWAQRLDLAWLLAAALCAVVWTVAAAPRLRSLGWATTTAVWLGVGVAAAGQFNLRRIANDWEQVRHEVEERAANALRREMDALWSAGQGAARSAAAVSAPTEPGPGGARGAAFARLATLRREAGVHAVARFAPSGDPLAWAGDHRGRVPDPVGKGVVSEVFRPGPVFGYLYFAVPAAGGGAGVAAVLLEADIAPGEGGRSFASHFADRYGLTPRFTAADQARGEAVWDWKARGRSILSVSFAAPTPERALTPDRWAARTTERSRRALLACWVLGTVLLATTWTRRQRRAEWLPLLIVTGGGLLLPLQEITGAERLFSSLRFVAPLPGDPRLGDVLLVLIAAGVAALAHRAKAEAPAPASPFRGMAPSWARVALQVALAALWLPSGVRLVRGSATPGLLASAPAGGFALQLATTLLLVLPLWLLWRNTTRPEGGSRHRTTLALTAAFVFNFGLAAWMVGGWAPFRAPRDWTPALWALPFAALLGATWGGGRGSLPRWLALGLLAGTVAVTHLWTDHLQARIAQAEEALVGLGVESDPFLEFLLDEFGDHALRAATEGAEGVDLLYRSWLASDLAREGYQARVTLWRDGTAAAELPLADESPPEEFVQSRLAPARAAREPLLQRFDTVPGVHYLLLVPLPDGRTVSVAVPPRRQLGRATPLARFLSPSPGYRGAGEETPEVELLSGPPGAPAPESRIRWVRARAGWRSEAVVRFPTGPLHAHLLVRLPARWLLGVRGALSLGALLGTLVALWAVARVLAGARPPIRLALRSLRGFRARLTLTLAVFFLLPTLAFGVAGYRILSAEALRGTAALALGRLEDAARRARSSVSPTSAQPGADLLLYRQGVLSEASAMELLDLGLFPGWLPAPVYLAFASGEDAEATEGRRLGGEPYLVAYRRLGPERVLATPAPLATGDLDRRQRELRDVVLFAALMGAALSLGLSLAVGRALATPIDRLGRAAAAVGRGNLRVRLPEARADEFGALNRSFNRMVRRLRRGRAAEVRAARLVAWGEMARQVAHEIKNPLTPIKLSVQHLRRAYRDGRPEFPDILDRNVDAVLHEIDRLSAISRAFARFGTPTGAAGTPPEPTSVAAVLDEILALYRGGADGIEYRVELPADLPRVWARTDELKEVLVNLLENSRGAMPDGGTITLRAAIDEEVGHLLLDVQDTGAGIEPALLPRIFDPQFSTRTSGTGLGLAIVRRLVEGWGGGIVARSEPGVGTTMRIRFRTEPDHGRG